MKRKSNLKILGKIFFFLYCVLILFYEETLAGGMKMRLSSPAFKEGDTIPLKYVMPAAGGQNISPPLKWEGVPSTAKSLLLICYDPHPVAKNWVHWLVINLSPQDGELQEGASTKKIPPPAKELKNSYGFVGYGGPQPPPGTGKHPYIFELYALSTERINLPDKPKYEEVLSVIKPNLIASAKLTVYFGR